MAFYDREILNGLDNIPTPESPGTLIVTGDAQSVFSAPNPGDTLMAACKRGQYNFVKTHLIKYTF